MKKGFEQNIPEINFVSNWKISLENLKIKPYDQSYHQKVKKSGKPIILTKWGKYLILEHLDKSGEYSPGYMVLFKNFLD